MTSQGRDLESLTPERFSDHDELEEVSEDLFSAVRRGDADKTQRILHHHRGLTSEFNSEGQPLLTVALAEGHGKVVEVLLNNGANVSYTDQSGNTPIHVVAGKGNYEALRVFLRLVQLPALDTQNNAGDTALMHPATRGFSVIVECLLQHNANPNIPNEAGRTPIMAAASKGHREVIKVLLKYGADILLTSFEDYSGMPTALREAVACGSADVTAYVAQSVNAAVERMKRLFTCKTAEEISSLIKSGCGVNHRKGDGSTPLMVHAEVGNIHVVKCLLQENAFMNAQDNAGQTALMKASSHGRLEVAKEIVVKGALIDLQCREGRTALMYSVLGRSLEICRFLIQSGADATISDNSGKTAEELAEQKEIYDYLHGRQLTRPTEMDAFAVKMNEYLKLKKKQQTSASNELTPTIKTGATASASMSSPNQRRRQERDRQYSERQETGQGGRGEPGQADAVTKELNTYIKRVAELETRVEELSINAEFAMADEEDLSYYRDQPDRLIEEFKKMKLAKKKAEHFAIEAKQSAQKASVELSQAREELVKEKASNELKTKHMVSNMDERFVIREQNELISEERGRTYRGIIAALKSQKPSQEDIKDEAEFTKGAYSSEEVFDIIANSKSKTRFKVALVGVSGLPQSGKSTLVKKLLPYNVGDSHQAQNGLQMFEASFRTTSRKPKWEEFKREDIYMFMLTRALVERNRLIPRLKEWSDLPAKCLPNHYLRTQFKALYCRMREGLEKFQVSDFRFHLMSEPEYVLLNVWDIGFNKALNESLPLMVRLIHPMLLLNLVNLHRDSGKNLRLLPEVRNNSQGIMQGRSRGHYCIRIAGLCNDPGRCVLIGTHKDKLVATEVQQVKKRMEAGLRAKASITGADKSLHSEMLAIDACSSDDCDCVKKCVESIIKSTDKFNSDVYLSWIFLRTALIHYDAIKSDFLISRAEFEVLARECGLKLSKEISDCLKFFTQKGSLLYHEEFFSGNIIYRPHIFFNKMNALYQAINNGDEHARESHQVGILCKSFANHIWKEDTQFFWDLLQAAGVAAPTTVCEGIPKDHYDFNIVCPHAPCSDKEVLFVSTLRKERFKRKKAMNSDSLYVTFTREYIPADIQRHFFKKIGSKIPGVKMRKEQYYNVTSFDLPNKGGEVMIIVHGDVVEVLTRNIPEHSKRDIAGILKTILVEVLDSSLEHFPGFEYQLALICPICLNIKGDDPPNNNTTSYLHFLPSQYETELYCRICKKMTKLNPGPRIWMEAPLQDDQSTEGECYEARLIDKTELTKVVRNIPLECYKCIHTNLGQLRSGVISEEAVVGVLMAWQQDSPCNRREKLAKILLRMGCYNAALKLHPPLLNASVEEVQPHPEQSVLTDIEIERICNCAVGWKKLAKALKAPADTVHKIGSVQYYSERDRSKRVLQSINGPGARETVVEALREMGWVTLAETLECGSISDYTSRCTHYTL